ncbi:hypothetical protein Sjap_019000 [Stephania japonica]|uniref:Pentatricopeptide repeat-containing protein n=1 Tax=Stephania japonica TaxID=461633 RepID=A0AAP0HYX9_9MAGN
MASIDFSLTSLTHEPRNYSLFGNIDRSNSTQISRTTLLKLKRIAVSKLSTELIDLSEPTLEDSVQKNQNLRANRYVRRRARHLWSRFRGGNREIKPEFVAKSDFSSNDSEQERSSDCSDEKIGERVRAVISIVGSDSSIDLCNSVLRNLEQISEDETLRFFEWMKKNGKLKGNVSAYNLAFRVLGRKEDWATAEMLIQELISGLGFRVDYRVFNTLIYTCYKKGIAKIGSKWFHLMLESGVVPNVATFGMLMSLYQKTGDVAEAEFAFRRMRRLRLQCQSAYSSMITIYTRLGLYDKAEEVIGCMKEDEVVPNFENWLVQLNAYAQQGKLVEADRVLESMKKSGFSPNIVAYNTVITGYGKVCNMDAAERAFRDLRSLKLEADETTYRSMVEGWGRAGNYEKSKWYYRKLKQSGFMPNSSNLYTMLNLQAKHGDEEGAGETIEDMRRMGCQYSSILSSLLQAYERTEVVHKVPLVLKGSFYEHILVDQTSCSVLVMAYVKHCLVDDALRVLRKKQWKDDVFEDNLYHLLICSCKESGHYQEAIKIFTHMPKLDSSPNLHITCTMIDIYSVIEDFSKAKELYLKLKYSRTALDVVAYTVIVRMFVKSGFLEDACSVLDEMEKLKTIIPDVFLIRDMLRIYQKCGLHEKLTELYYKIRKTEVPWDQEMYNCVINCCAQALPVDELSQIFGEMLHCDFTPNTITFNVMLDVYGKAKLFKKARKVFWMARKHGLADVITYNTIIAAYGEGKDFRNMRAIVKKMQFDGFSVSLETYNCMLDAYGKSRQMEKFKDVLQRMKASNCASDHYTYCILINIYGEQGWIDEVAQVLGELKQCGVGANLCSYNTLIKAYGIAGMVEEAVAVVNEMREHGIEPDKVTYINLIRALQRNDNFLEAVKWSLWMKQIGISSSKC